ncbi:MAG: acetate kinase [Oscillospiraceae bacterium]|nr:acetate kinase [Oscillospiraceae bacterium]
MKILVVNAGSSSLKYQLIDMTDEKLLAKGLCERIGIDGIISHKAADGREYNAKIPMPTHSEAFDALVFALNKSDAKVIDSMDEIGAVGHRVVQGGAIFSKSTLVNDKVIDDIESLNELAPLHNPAHVLGIRACIKALGVDVPEVAVFDTSFHQTMPPKAFMYALPYEYYEKYKVRRYGFHGTSHRYVSDRCAAIMGCPKKDIRMITCHLGNGCSISAIKDGVCIDTSMGFTPLDGFMMGTRTGTVDPSAITFIAEKENLSPKEMSDLCNKKSGVLGISGVSSDNRDIEKAAKEGNVRAQLATDMQRYQVVKFIGSYIAAMGGADAIVFTGGIGENDASLREYVMDKLSFLGIKCNQENNKIRGKEIKISTDDSKVSVYIIPTNEELVIARDTLEIVNNLKG